ncbi:MAG: HEPN domain-containing protein [Armatimonadota bacterium]
MGKASLLTREEVLKRLKSAIEQMLPICEPEFVVLFGSFAYGEPDEGSDVDLLVVYPDDADEAKRRDAVSALHRSFGTRLEVHPCTLSQWKEALLKRNWFVADITKRGIPLFSRREWKEILEEVNMRMGESKNLYPFEWLERAKEDWRLTELALSEGLVLGAAYHLQQAIEKWLKAYLLYHGWKLERTHDLEELLSEAVKHEPNLQRFQDMCRRVKYFIAARYPGLPNPPTEEELRQQWLPKAKELGNFVCKALGANHIALEVRENNPENSPR